LMADYVAMAADAGVRIIGGCCGTSPDHIKAMRDAIDNYEASPRPTLETITEKIGVILSPPHGDGADAPKRERRGRRRA
ncbi:MAG: homocysteine S-methyltransferase family protein, partial [Hyphomicrobiales bacterium]